jgi:hypothetical protein
MTVVEDVWGDLGVAVLWRSLLVSPLSYWNYLSNLQGLRAR